MQLQESRADRDVELLLKVMQFYDILLEQPKEAADVIGVNLQDVRANTVNIKDVIVNVHKADDPPAPGEEPYKGLLYFDVADAELFFGREKLTAELVDHLRRNSFLAVIGASGSGKSSLVRAGVKDVLFLDHHFPMEFCDDCGAPLYPNVEAELVHAEMPEQPTANSQVLH